jgi:hypothetical protein
VYFQDNIGIKTLPDIYIIDVSGDIRCLNSKVAIGIEPVTYPLTVSGDINLIGDYRKNGAIFKPDNTFLENNATKLATL